MNGPGDIPLTHNTSPDSKPCGFTSIIPSLGMSSCRGRAEAFARSLQSKLKTLGSQNDNKRGSEEDELIVNGGPSSTWIPTTEPNNTVTDIQPTRLESDSFFDFDCELESPGSPVDECEYLRLIETTSNTPHNSNAESGYVCASVASSHSSSSDEPYFDPESSESEHQDYKKSSSSTILPCVDYSLTPGPRYDELEKVELSKEEQFSDSPENKLPSNNFKKNIEVIDHVPIEDMPTSSKQHNSETEDFSLTIQNEVLKELQVQSGTYDTEHLGKENSMFQMESTATETPAVETPNYESEIQTFETTVILQNDPVANAYTNTTELMGDDKISRESIPNASLPNERDEELFLKVDDLILCHEPNRNQQHLASLDTDDDEDECRPQRVRRCSSLKTGKTPPGTPGRKKIVRFADVLGLDLADIKTFLDEIPTIPKSAFEDLEVVDIETPIQLGPKSEKLLMPLFQQPAGLPNFLDIVREKQVSLENAAVTDNINQTITGTVRVRNLDFNKSVHIRYTLDGWRSFADLQANYVNNSCDGFSDKFAFILFGNSLNIGQSIEFAVRFQCKGQQFWDNNFGTNYCFQCLPSSTSTSQNTSSSNSFIPPYQTKTNNSTSSLSLCTEAGDSWCNSFY